MEGRCIAGTVYMSLLLQLAIVICQQRQYNYPVSQKPGSLHYNIPQQLHHNSIFTNDLWQRGSLFNYRQIVGERFDIGVENHVRSLQTAALLQTNAICEQIKWC